MTPAAQSCYYGRIDYGRRRDVLFDAAPETGPMRVKICGITNLEDAELAVALGADALGFIVFPRSPRCVSPAAARAIIDRLPATVLPVAVVVNETVDAARAIMAESGCRVAQLHGQEPPAFLDALGYPAIKALSVATQADLAPIPSYAHAAAILLDTKVAGQHGGTGVAFDWTLARTAQEFGQPIILAGGLNPENVAEAIRVAQPCAVDVSSGVEREPGRKDPEKLRALFAAIRAASATNRG